MRSDILGPGTFWLDITSATTFSIFFRISELKEGAPQAPHNSGTAGMVR